MKKESKVLLILWAQNALAVNLLQNSGKDSKKSPDSSIDGAYYNELTCKQLIILFVINKSFPFYLLPLKHYFAGRGLLH